MAAQFAAAMEMMEKMGFTNKDLDEMKGIFADTNIYLLGVTIFVASFHVSKVHSETLSLGVVYNSTCDL